MDPKSEENGRLPEEGADAAESRRGAWQLTRAEWIRLASEDKDKKAAQGKAMKKKKKKKKTLSCRYVARGSVAILAQGGVFVQTWHKRACAREQNSFSVMERTEVVAEYAPAATRWIRRARKMGACQKKALTQPNLAGGPGS
mmetsp:Transcript_6264/g.5024  ORF Transcript_6264/g.5024 Transcript_6264/m.5024 type:complete len:142 (-) Transcript_6264:92-517(-)